MKTNIVIFLLFVITYSGVHSQSTFNPSKSSECIISSEQTEYLSIEKGWVREKKLWYYYGNQIMVTPVFYALVETIDSTYVSNEIETKTRIEISEESSGAYQSTEDGWKWNDETWTFNGDAVRSYPPSFTRKSKVERVIVDNESQETTQQNDIEEFYQIEDEKWTWDENKKIWLYDNVYIQKLPKYKITQSRIVTSNIRSI